MSSIVKTRLFTLAWAAGLAKVTGKLSPGMSADFIVLDRDLFTIPVDQIHATQVRETWFGGRLVHNASAGKPLW